MRLLYVCSDFGIPPAGTKGPSIHLRSITGALCAKGHECVLLSPKDGPGGDHPLTRLLEAGCPPAEREAKGLKRWLRSHGYSEALGRELRPLLYNPWVYKRALEALRAKRVDCIIERLSLFGHSGVDLAEALDLPLVLEVNALLTEESRAFRSLQLGPLAEQMEDRALSRADAVIVVSEPLAERVAQRGVDREKIHVVSNGVNVELFDAAPSRRACRDELGLADQFTVGFVGTLKVWHGVNVLLDAFTRLHKADASTRLLIVGTGPMEEKLRQAARLDGIEDAVTFAGAVEHARVPYYVRAMDVAVAPYLSFDGFYFSPLKLFEYMAANTCLVASRLGQIERIVHDGVDGILCKPDDADDLCSQIRELKQDSDLRDSLAQRARQEVLDHHTWNHAAGKTLRVIDDVLAARAASRPRLEAGATR